MNPDLLRANATRGVSNSNPGNIRVGVKWYGLRAEQTDPAFCQFDKPEYGIRAMAVLLRGYQFGYRHDKHLLDLISTYAPSIENDSSGYAAFVARSMGVNVHDVLDLNKQPVLVALIKAMIAMECAGYVYQNGEVERGVAMASSNTPPFIIDAPVPPSVSEADVLNQKELDQFAKGA